MNAVAPSVNLNVVTNSNVDIFSDETGIVKALSTLRQAAISSKEKNQLRNLFLNYAGESDEGIRGKLKSQIIEEIAKHPQLASLTTNTKKPESVTSSKTTRDALGYTRPVPTFVVTNYQESKSSTPDSDIAPKETVDKDEVVAGESPTPLATQNTANIPPPQETTKPTAVTPPPVPEPAPAPGMAVDVRARIDTIKHDINSKVGNPVNLISADSTIGREYMSALLDAMKHTSTGGGAEYLPRLESAYKAALALIAEKGLDKNNSTRSEEKANESITPKVVETTSVSQEIKPTAKVIESAPQTDQVTQTEALVVETPVVVAEAPVEQKEGLYHLPSDEVESNSNTDSKPVSSFASRFFNVPLVDKEVTEQKEIARTTDLDTKTTETKTDTRRDVNVEAGAKVRQVAVNTKNVETKASNETPNEKLKPVSDIAVALPQKIAAIKSANLKREEAVKRPITDLKAPEIEAGLKQLLSEWVLFKKSGFFGTGPSGIDHPLYKQLSGMPMAAVISGRFEGVTPEIKRHLSDYMTGWRYEQGIMHEMGETFENYLRRVIREVLEKERTRAAKKTNQ